MGPVTDDAPTPTPTGEPQESPGTDPVPEGIDTARPSVARLYDYFLGGRHNFAADRELGQRLLEAEPDARLIVRENRAFLGRSVRYVASRGVDQFLDLGSGIPTQENVHQIARRAAPGSRVVYVDNDPSAVAHSSMILRDDRDTGAILQDLRRPDAVLNDPVLTRLIDLDRPVGLLMVTVLHFVPDADDPYGVVTRYRDALAPGSFLVLSHATHEASPDNAAAVEKLYQSSARTGAYTRPRSDIARFFAGFDLVEPGLVYVPQWRPDTPEQPEHPERAWFYAGVGRLSRT